MAAAARCGRFPSTIVCPRSAAEDLLEETPRIDLASAGFKRDQLPALERSYLKSTFASRSWSLDTTGFGPNGERPPARYDQRGSADPVRLIRAVLRPVGDGKEATAYCCRAAKEVPFEFALAKVYRAVKFRHFANADLYTAGETIRDRRSQKAMEQKSGKGRRLRHRVWVDREWETLCELHDAGADVPAPYACARDVVLMEFIGDEDRAAALLLDSTLERGEAQRLYERLVANVELFLACDRVHGDLSAYNVLYQDGKIWIIDFPQSVDARRNPNARQLLVRDLRNLARYFRRYGVRDDTNARASRLWSRYQRAEL